MKTVVELEIAYKLKFFVTVVIFIIVLFISYNYAYHKGMRDCNKQWIKHLIERGLIKVKDGHSEWVLDYGIIDVNKNDNRVITTMKWR